MGDLKEHVADLRAQLAKDEQLAQASNIINSMQEGQDMARDLIKMLGERVVDMSKRELPSGSKDSNLGSNRATQHDELGTHVATTLIILLPMMNSRVARLLPRTLMSRSRTHEN